MLLGAAARVGDSFPFPSTDTAWGWTPPASAGPKRVGLRAGRPHADPPSQQQDGQLPLPLALTDRAGRLLFRVTGSDCTPVGLPARGTEHSSVSRARVTVRTQKDDRPGTGWEQRDPETGRVTVLDSGSASDVVTCVGFFPDFSRGV